MCLNTYVYACQTEGVAGMDESWVTREYALTDPEINVCHKIDSRGKPTLSQMLMPVHC